MRECALALGILVCGCDNAAKPKTQPAAGVSAAPVGTDDAEAIDAANVIKTLHPLRCVAGKADWKWAKCHDEMKGFDNVLACVREVKASAESAAGQLPTGKVAKSPCGGTIEAAVRDNVTLTAQFLSDTEKWLVAHRAEMTPRMQMKSFWDACSGKACEGRPNSYAPPYDKSLFSEDKMSCTKELFRCGAPDNVCFIGKVAGRLGVACDPKENHVSDSYHDVVSVRATGTRIAPR